MESSSSQKYQQVLIDLGLVKSSSQRKGKIPTSTDVLNQLLLDKIVDEDSVRNVYDLLRSNRTSNKEQEQTVLNKNKKPLSHHDNTYRDSENTNKNCITKSASSSLESNIRHRHIALHVYYDGEKYSGLADNVGSLHDESIERSIFQALAKSNLVLHRENAHYSRCGRTDKGVSAAGQVIAMHMKSSFPFDATFDKYGTIPVTDDDLPNNSFDACKVWITPRKPKKEREVNDDAMVQERVEKELYEYAYDKILNNLLPPTIRILGWCCVSPEFSARFSTISRTYRYFFIRNSQMNVHQMIEGLQLLIGNHDFRNFCKMDIEKVYNFQRCIKRAELIQKPENNICYFEIQGQAFLWHQIRCIVHILFLIGYGLENPHIITELFNIEKYPGKPSYPLANELPLVLHDCNYHHLNIVYTPSNLWHVQSCLEQQYDYYMICAARIRNCIETVGAKMVSSKQLFDFSKKQYNRRKQKTCNNSTDHTDPSDDTSQQVISWTDAMIHLNELGLYTDSAIHLTETSSYTPLLQRSKGTTYEEKVAALNYSNKRKARHERNVIQKRKSKEDDNTFYDHMTKQGSRSGIVKEQ